MALAFHAPLTEKPFVDGVDDKTISSTLEPSITTKFGLPWSEFTSSLQEHISLSNEDATSLFADEFTIGLWAVFRPGAVVSEMLNWYTSGSDVAFSMQRLSNSQMIFRTYAAGGADQVFVLAPQNLAINSRAVFISATYSSIRQVSLQVCGYISPLSTRPTALGSSTGGIQLGRRVGAGNPHDGWLRDFKVWDEVLSNEERLDIYRSGLWSPETCRAGARGFRSSADSQRTVANPGL